MALDQALFRGRNDDGTETSATWKAALNIGWTQAVDENLRVRFESIENANKGEKDGVQLQYNKNAAGWNDVNAASLNVRSSASANFADNTNTTQQLSAGAFAVLNGAMDENNGFANEAGEEQKNNSIEYEFCVQIRSVDVVNNDTIQLRIVRAGGAGVFETYTQTPTITVSAAPGAQVVTPTFSSAVLSAVAITLVAGAATLAPSFSSSVFTAATPTVSNAQTVSPLVASSALASPVAIMIAGAATLTPGVASSVLSATLPAVTSGPVTLIPSASVAAFIPVSALVVNGITAVPAVASAALSSPVVTASSGVVTATPGASSSAFSTPLVTVSVAVTVTPSASASVFSSTAPVVSNDVTAVPGAAVSVFSSTVVAVTVGSATVAPLAATSVLSVATPTVTAGASTVLPAVAASAFGSPPVIVVNGITLTPGVATSAFAAITAVATAGAVNLSPGASSSAFISAAVVAASGAVTVSPTVAAASFSSTAQVVVTGQGVAPSPASLAAISVSVSVVAGATTVFPSASSSFLAPVAPTVSMVFPNTLTPETITSSFTAPAVTIATTLAAIHLSDGKITDDGTIDASLFPAGIFIEGVSGYKTITIDGTSTLAAATLATGSQSGALGAGTTTTALKKPTTAANWTVNDLKGSFVQIASGLANGSVFPVISNTVDTITVHTIAAVVAGDSYAIVTPGSDLGVVTITGCTARFKFKACKIERLVSDSNNSVHLESCHFDTASVSGSMISQNDTFMKLENCLANNAASLVAKRCVEVDFSEIVLETAVMAVNTCQYVTGNIYANAAVTTPIAFTNCLKVECGCDSNNNISGADGVLVDGSAFAVSGIGMKGTGNGGYGIRVDGVSARVDITGATITGAGGDIIVGTTAKTWAAMAIAGGVFDSGIYAVVGQGMTITGNVALVAGTFTTNANFNQAGRLLTYGFQHDNANGLDLGVTAHFGGGQANAFQLQAAPVAVVFNVVTAGDSVKLDVNHAGLGARKEVVNNHPTNALALFPAVGHKINGVLNGSFSVPVNTRAVCTAVNATDWIVTI